jgi:hypothetical protein
MGVEMDKDVSAACQMFLIPSTIMFAALANAGTEGLKVGIGLVGVSTAVIWLKRLRKWIPPDIKAADRSAAMALSILFVVAWAVVTIVHFYFGCKYGFMKS